MSGLFGGGSPAPQPVPVTPPPPPPVIEDTAAQQQQSEDELRARKGEASTILTGAQGTGSPTVATPGLKSTPPVTQLGD